MLKSDYIKRCLDVGIGLSGKETVDELKHKLNEVVPKFTEKVMSTTYIDYIVHTADLHFRHDTRLDEYAIVFDRMIEKIKKNVDIKKHNVITCICGDIIHQKEKISGNMVWSIRQLLYNLSTVGEVIIINGNHDIYEGREDRVPILRSICNGIPKVYYIEESGIYKFGQISFGVSSLYDRKIVTRDKISEVLDAYCIGLGHFALTETGVASSRTLNKNVFKGYGYMLLGDIHETGIYGNCVYPGSLIQQNHGESLTKGFGLINMRDNTYKGIRVNNDYGHITIDIGTDLSTVTFPTKTYLRINMPFKDDAVYEDKIEQVKRLTEVIDIKQHIKAVLSDSVIVNRLIQERSNGYKSETDYLHDASIHDEQQAELLKLHHDVIRDMSEEVLNLGKRYWRIKTLEFKNMLTFGEDKVHKFVFEGNQIIGLMGKNYSGKSSFMKILTYALCGTLDVSHMPIGIEGNSVNSVISNHGSTDLSYKGIPMLNYDKKTGYTKLEIETNNDRYLIERKQTQSIRTNKQETLLYKWDGVMWKYMEDKKRDIERYITTHITNVSSLFMMTNICSTNMNTSITTMHDSDRFNVFNNILGMNIFASITLRIKDIISSNKQDKIIAEHKHIKLIGMLNDRESHVLLDICNEHKTKLHQLHEILLTDETEYSTLSTILQTYNTEMVTKNRLLRSIDYYDDVDTDSEVDYSDIDTTLSIRDLHDSIIVMKSNITSYDISNAIDTTDDETTIDYELTQHSLMANYDEWKDVQETYDVVEPCGIVGDTYSSCVYELEYLLQHKQDITTVCSSCEVTTWEYMPLTEEMKDITAIHVSIGMLTTKANVDGYISTDKTEEEVDEYLHNKYYEVPTVTLDEVMQHLDVVDDPLYDGVVTESGVLALEEHIKCYRYTTTFNVSDIEDILAEYTGYFNYDPFPCDPIDLNELQPYLNSSIKVFKQLGDIDHTKHIDTITLSLKDLYEVDVDTLTTKLLALESTIHEHIHTTDVEYVPLYKLLSLSTEFVDADPVDIKHAMIQPNLDDVLCRYTTAFYNELNKTKNIAREHTINEIKQIRSMLKQNEERKTLLISREALCIEQDMYNNYKLVRELKRRIMYMNDLTRLDIMKKKLMYQTYLHYVKLYEAHQYYTYVNYKKYYNKLRLDEVNRLKAVLVDYEHIVENEKKLNQLIHNELNRRYTISVMKRKVVSHEKKLQLLGNKSYYNKLRIIKCKKMNMRMKCLIDLTKEAQGDITTEVDDLISKQQAIEVKRTEVLERIQHSKLKIEVLMQQLVEKEEEHKYVEHLEKDASILHDTLEKKISEGLIMAKYYNYMSVNGHVNRIMLDDKLSNMSSKVNKLISKFIHIRCTFNINEMDKKRGIVVDITKNDKKISIKHLSGFELFVFDICTKLAIAEESSRCISNMFMIDEGLDVIDEDMWKRVDDILNLITERYNTMFIITHRDGIQDRYNRKIQIDNGNIINDELI